MKRRTWMQTAAALAAGAALPAAWAEGYPSRTIRMVVPYSAGGGLDAITRVVAQAMGEILGQTIVVDNRGGGGGIIGAESVARAAPDGYTVLMAGNPELVIAQALTPANVRYNVLKDFVPITLVSESANIVIAHPSVTGSLGDILSGKVAVPGGIAVGTPGQGSPQHILLEVLQGASKEKLVHIPYKGAGPAVADVMAGQIKLGIVGAPPVLAGMKAGKLRGLAVTGHKRSALAPDVPTIEEATGVKGTENFSTWYGLLAPAGTPQPAVDALQKAVTTVLARPEIRARLAGMGTEVLALPPAAFAERMRSDIKRYDEAVRRYNIKPE